MTLFDMERFQGLIRWPSLQSLREKRVHVGRVCKDEAIVGRRAALYNVSLTFIRPPLIDP